MTTNKAELLEAMKNAEAIACEARHRARLASYRRASAMDNASLVQLNHAVADRITARNDAREARAAYETCKD